MGIFSVNENSYIDESLDTNELLETYIYDEISRLSDETRREFVQSEAANTMMKKGLIGKRTLVKLSKSDDIERRLGMAALQLAKDSNDPLFTQLAKVRTKERTLLNKINEKYANKAQRVARMAQKEYLKNRIPVGFMRK